MKKYLSLLLIFTHLFVFAGQSFPGQKVKEMTITKSKNNALLANKGSDDGIVLKTVYDVLDHSNNKIVGQAKVLIVKNKKCGLKIFNLESGYNVTPGDKLILNSTFEEDKLLNEIMSSEPDENIVNTQQDYFYLGQDMAQREYGGGGATAGGVAAGLGLGLIGWGLGYVIVANKGVEVPRHHISNLDIQKRWDFSSGYTEYVKKKRNSRFNGGAAIGTLLAVALVLSLSSSN